MTLNPTDSDGNSGKGILTWLRSPVTLTLPGWAFAAGGLVLVMLILLALD
jgi:hypothetical protein